MRLTWGRYVLDLFSPPRFCPVFGFCSLSSSQQVREDHSLSSLGEGTADRHSFCPPFILNQDHRKKQTEAIAGTVYMLQLEIKKTSCLLFLHLMRVSSSTDQLFLAPRELPERRKEMLMDSMSEKCQVWQRGAIQDPCFMSVFLWAPSLSGQ